MYQIKKVFLGDDFGLEITYNGIDGNGDTYIHPYYGNSTVHSFDSEELEYWFGSQCPNDVEVLNLLESSGILSDLGLAYCPKKSDIND